MCPAAFPNMEGEGALERCIIGTVNTDATGRYTVPISTSVVGPVHLEVTSGSFVHETNFQQIFVTPDTSLRALYGGDLVSGSSITGAIGPLTEIATARAIGNMAVQPSTAQAAAANADVARLFGMAGVDIIATNASDLRSPTAVGGF